MRELFDNYLKNGLSEYDSKYLSTDMYQTIKERLLACSYHNFQKIVQQILK